MLNIEEETDMQQKKPTVPAAKPSLVTQPSPTILSRIVKRFTAYCPIGGDAEGCEAKFNERKTPTLHTNKGAAQVEAVRHIRSAHADTLFMEREAKRQRQVVNESLALVE
jgi:hypothetical protein